MAQNTKVTPTEMRQSADKHRTTNESFTTAEDNLSRTVEDLHQRSRNALTDRLVVVHKEWQDSMEAVQKRLETMTAYLEDSATQMETATSGHAQDLR
jgi:uncharacterized protein YukE